VDTVPAEYQLALDWLLETDPANPGVRYLALRHLLGRPDSDAEVAAARRVIVESGPAAATLAAQGVRNPERFCRFVIPRIPTSKI
jgi:hypothetical protein